MNNRKYEIVPVKNEIIPVHNQEPQILDGTYRKPVSKKRWKQPNETLWMTVFMLGFFLMSGGENFLILLISLAMTGTSIWKLRNIDLDDVC